MPKLCKAGQQLREQIDDAFPDRSRIAPEGWLGDKRHALRVSDHNPQPDSGIVRAYDFNADLGPSKHEIHDLVDQLRLLARSDKRISYIIFDGKIASWKRNYKWRKYTGSNPHRGHFHISFTAKGDHDGSMFRIPLLTGEASDKDGAGIANDHAVGNSGSTSGKPASCPTCKGSGLYRG
jgi:hypothetical protein